ncbi:PAP2 superfamily C-terminal-domain-containing protein [Paraphysoderma sedebokerense]|nr:PAP2 superfamily C-terminal-domain-containing protein [Paraphysoderma sedebokerense]
MPLPRILRRSPLAPITSLANNIASPPRRISSLPRQLFNSVKPYLKLYRSPHDLRLLGISFLYAFIGSYTTCLSNSHVDRINPNNLVPIPQRTVLLDPPMQAGYEWFSKTGIPPDVSDWLVRLAFALIIIRCSTLSKWSATAMRRVFYTVGTVYLLRAACVVATVLPNPLVNCESKPYDNIWYDALMLALQQRMSCGDVFFSGHTMFFVVTYRVWHTYTPSSQKFLLFIPFAVSFLGMASLVVSSYHYTIDVVVGFLITVVCWSIYHWVAWRWIGQYTWWGRAIRYLDGQERIEKEEQEVDLGGRQSQIENLVHPPAIAQTNNVPSVPIEIIVTAESRTPSISAEEKPKSFNPFSGSYQQPHPLTSLNSVPSIPSRSIPSGSTSAPVPVPAALPVTRSASAISITPERLPSNPESPDKIEPTTITIKEDSIGSNPIQVQEPEMIEVQSSTILSPSTSPSNGIAQMPKLASSPTPSPPSSVNSLQRTATEPAPTGASIPTEQSTQDQRHHMRSNSYPSVKSQDVNSSSIGNQNSSSSNVENVVNSIITQLPAMPKLISKNSSSSLASLSSSLSLGLGKGVESPKKRD